MSKALANTGKRLLFYKYNSLLSHFLSSMLANNCLEHGPQLQCFCVPPVSSELLFCGDRQSMYVFAGCSTVTELRHLCLLAGTFSSGSSTGSRFFIDVWWIRVALIGAATNDCCCPPYSYLIACV